VEFQGLENREAVIYEFPMTGKVAIATDEAGAIPVGDDDIPREPPQDFLKDARRRLAQDPAIAAQWAPYEIERLDFEVSRLRKELTELRRKNEFLSEQNADGRVDLEKLRGASAISKRNEILYTVLTSGGSAGVTVATVYWSTPVVEPFAKAVFAISLLAIAAGLLLRKWN
jgi:hypothetical protein